MMGRTQGVLCALPSVQLHAGLQRAQGEERQQCPLAALQPHLRALGCSAPIRGLLIVS